MKVERIMTKDVCGATGEQTLDGIAQLMCSYDLRCVPIVDHAGVVVGVVTARDVATVAQSARPLSTVPAETVMTRAVVACHGNDGVAAAVALMERYHVRRLPVVDDDNHLVGILSRNDLERCATAD